MKRIIKLFLLLALLLPVDLPAQKDSIHLICPLNQAIVVPPPKNVIHYDIADLCIVLVSIMDTVVKACIGGRVTNVVANEDIEGKWDIVFFSRYNNKDYYFWYSGLDKVIIRRNDILKQGQAIGFVRSNDKIEMLMYEFETQLDPTKYLDCGGILKSE